MAEDVVAGHPLLMKTAVLSGECKYKLEILTASPEITLSAFFYSVFIAYMYNIFMLF